MKTNALGIMGGTFDPIHFGHLIAAEEAWLRFELNEVIFVPNCEPPHKRDYEITPAEHRYAMTALATADNPDFSVSRVELEHGGPSYTVDTMRYYREQVGPQGRLYFITGADAMLETLTWRQPEEIARLCEFLAVTRPGYTMARLEEGLPPEIMSRVRPLEIPGVAISSSELRARAAAGESLRYLAPPAVANYIEVHGLYRGK